MNTQKLVLFNTSLAVISRDEDIDMVISRAVRVAQRSGGRVTILMSYYKQLDDIPEETIDQYIQNKKQQVKDKILLLDGSALIDEIVFSWQQPTWDVATELLNKQEFGVIFKSPEPHHLFKDMFTNNLDNAFINQCSAPVWLVKPKSWVADCEILACIDVANNSPKHQSLNHEIMAVSDFIAQLFSAQLHVIDCYYGEIGSMRIDYNAKTGFKREASLKQQHQEMVKPVIKDYCVAEDALHFLEGIPDDAIPDTALELSAELTVIGDTGSSFTERLFGDTALRLSEKMPCDILILKPEQ
jgi:universal stress protein E